MTVPMDSADSASGTSTSSSTEAKSALEGLVLTEAQLTALEKAKNLP